MPFKLDRMNQNRKSKEHFFKSKQTPNRAITHFNWFARFDMLSDTHKHSVKS